MNKNMQLNTKCTLISNIQTMLNQQDQQKIKDIIRKKAQLYGLSQLRNPLNYKNRQSILIPKIILNNNNNNITLSKKPNMRSKSSLTSKTALKRKITQIIPQLTSRINQNVLSRERLFPYLNQLTDLIKQQRQITHVFKDKLQYDINDIVFYYLKILALAIQYEGKIFQQQIVKQKCIVIYTLETITESLLELGYNKIAFYLAAISVDLCEFYKQFKYIGKFLLVMAKVLRRLFKYEQSIVLLKKSLEYVWLQRRLYQEENNQINDKQKANSNHQKHRQNQYERQTQQTSIKTSRPNQQHTKTNASNTHRQYNSQPRHLANKPAQFLQPRSSMDNQLQIYNQLSYCLLQLNKKQQSQIFGQKYQIGFIQKQSSNVLNLSRQLINSAQKRIIKWQRVDKKRLFMLLGIQLSQYLQVNETQIKAKFNENKLLQDLKFNFDLFLDNFFQKQMFFYEIPLPLQLKKQSFIQSTKKLPRLAVKFVIKTNSTTKKSRATSLKSNNFINKKNQKVQQNRILIYRDISFCRTKLTNILKKYINFIRKNVKINKQQKNPIKKEDTQNFQTINKFD